MNSPIIFLDNDGVLLPCGDNVPRDSIFLLRCVEALKSVFTAIPTTKVVFSSTWRLPSVLTFHHGV